jgi:hypothetical protein
LFSVSQSTSFLREPGPTRGARIFQNAVMMFSDVEVLVVDDVDDLTLDDFLELRQVADVTRFRVDVTLDRDVQGVVMSVPVRVVALAEQPGVLGVGELRIVNTVGGVEAQPAGDCYARHV